jgi:hypothetical protein
MDEPLKPSQELLEVESEAAHAAVEAFFGALTDGLKKRGLPMGAVMELAETDHVHESVLLWDGGKEQPLGIRTSINFSGSSMVVQKMLEALKPSVGGG